MPYKKEIAKKRKLPENIWKFLNDEHPDPGNDVDIFLLQEDGTRKLWDESKNEIMAAWIMKHPGTRPTLWWDFDAPRTLPGPRRRLGGIGTPGFEVLAHKPYFFKGLPVIFISKSQEDFYNGRQVDIHGKKISTYNEGDFKGVAIDSDDPPVFESETAYLQRHGFLTEAEKKFIEKHPELMDPEKIEIEAEE